MANNYKEVAETALAGIDGALIQETAAFQTASLTGDMDEQVRASQSIAGLRATKREYIAMANEAIQSQRPRQAPLQGEDQMSRGDVELARRFGLTSQQLSIAKNWTTDPQMKDETRVQRYCENVQRYRQARADGSYRDDQGRR